MVNCHTPVTLKDQMVVPCGRCGYCRDRKLNEWAVRLIAQCNATPFNAHFITLTYSTKFLPFQGGKPSLDPRDITLFLHRLRKMHQRAGNVEKVKYVLAGEYGGKLGRPHYHAIIFGAHMEHIIDAWKDVETGEHLGNIRFGSVSPASIKYTLKYLMKESDGEKVVNGSPFVHPIREFQRFSKGLGKDWMTENMIRWHKKDLFNRIYVPLNGAKYPMPRYYKDRIYTAAEKALIFDYWSNREIDGLDFESIQIVNAWRDVCRERQIKKLKIHDY